MKKSTKILLIVAIVLVVVALVFLVVTKKPANNNEVANNNVNGNAVIEEEVKGNLSINAPEDLEPVFEKIYGEEEMFGSMMGEKIALDDPDALFYETGLKDAENVEFAYRSSPMIGSIPYAAVVVKVKDASKANDVAKEMVDNINPNRWICVSAEKIYATTSGDIVFLVMGPDDMAKVAYNNFKTEAGKVGQEYDKTNDRAMSDDIPEAEVVNGPISEIPEAEVVNAPEGL